MTTAMHDEADIRQIAEELSVRLTAQYGAVLGSTALIKELGYPSSGAFQQAWCAERSLYLCFALSIGAVASRWRVMLHCG